MSEFIRSAGWSSEGRWELCACCPLPCCPCPHPSLSTHSCHRPCPCPCSATHGVAQVSPTNSTGLEPHTALTLSWHRARGTFPLKPSTPLPLFLLLQLLPLLLSVHVSYARGGATEAVLICSSAHRWDSRDGSLGGRGGGWFDHCACCRGRARHIGAEGKGGIHRPLVLEILNNTADWHVCSYPRVLGANSYLPAYCLSLYSVHNDTFKHYEISIESCKHFIMLLTEWSDQQNQHVRTYVRTYVRTAVHCVITCEWETSMRRSDRAFLISTTLTLFS